MNAKNEIVRDVRWSIALSVLMIVAGVLAIFVPFASGVAVTLAVGWLLVLGGGAHLAYAWQARREGGLFWGLLLGVSYIIVGGYALLHPLAGLASLTLVVAAYLLMAAILEFILSFQLRPLRGSGWLLFDGVISLILAIMIWRSWPINTLWVVGSLAGLSMVSSGFSRLAISLAARRVIRAVSGEFHQAEPSH